MSETGVGQRGCVTCGGQLWPVEKELTAKRRTKFGVFWLLVTLFTAGFGFLVWLVWPRHKVVVGVDRFFACRGCGARQG